jgi:hypothetical protein
MTDGLAYVTQLELGRRGILRPSVELQRRRFKTNNTRFQQRAAAHNAFRRANEPDG